MYCLCDGAVPKGTFIGRQADEIPHELQFVHKDRLNFARETLHSAPAGLHPKEPTIQIPNCWRWSPEQLGDWLSDAGYGRYRSILLKNQDMYGRTLPSLDANDLRRMGIRDWADCRGIAGAMDDLKRRLVEVDGQAYVDCPYPYYPAMYFGDQPDLTSASEKAQRLESFRGGPTRKDTFRHIYRTAGDRFYYFDHNKPLTTQ